MGGQTVRLFICSDVCSFERTDRRTDVRNFSLVFYMGHRPFRVRCKAKQHQCTTDSKGFYGVISSKPPSMSVSMTKQSSVTQPSSLTPRPAFPCGPPPPPSPLSPSDRRSFALVTRTGNEPVRMFETPSFSLQLSYSEVIASLTTRRPSGSPFQKV